MGARWRSGSRGDAHTMIGGRRALGAWWVAGTGDAWRGRRGDLRMDQRGLRQSADPSRQPSRADAPDRPWPRGPLESGLRARTEPRLVRRRRTFTDRVSAV